MSVLGWIILVEIIVGMPTCAALGYGLARLIDFVDDLERVEVHLG